jgi:hypothetical protein
MSPPERSTSVSALAHAAAELRWFSKASPEEICEISPDVDLTIATALGQNVTAKVRGPVDRIGGYVFAGEIDPAAQVWRCGSLLAETCAPEAPRSHHTLPPRPYTWHTYLLN